MSSNSPLGLGAGRFIWRSEFILTHDLKFLETEAGERLEKEALND